MNKLNLKSLNLRFDHKKHIHYLNDKKVPGCTTIAGILPKPWMAPWACKEMEKFILKCISPFESLTQIQIMMAVKEGKGAYLQKRDKSADWGTKAHDWCSRHIIDGTLPPATESIEVLSSVNQFLLWKEKVNPKFLISEHQVGSEIWQFGAIIDCVIEDSDGLWITEIKTSNDVFTYPKFPNMNIRELKKEMALQTAAQAICLQEMGAPPLQGRRILHLPKTGEPYLDYKIKSDQNSDGECYLAALKLWQCLGEIK